MIPNWKKIWVTDGGVTPEAAYWPSHATEPITNTTASNLWQTVRIILNASHLENIFCRCLHNEWWDHLVDNYNDNRWLTRPSSSFLSSFSLSAGFSSCRVQRLIIIPERFCSYKNILINDAWWLLLFIDCWAKLSILNYSSL